MITKDSPVRHHLMEIFTFEGKTFRYTTQELKNFGIYDDYKLTITISRKEHGKLHSGAKWYTNGHQNILAFECPNGYYEGRTMSKYRK